MKQIEYRSQESEFRMRKAGMGISSLILYSDY